METSKFIDDLARAKPADLLVYSDDGDLLQKIEAEVRKVPGVSVVHFKGAVVFGGKSPAADQVMALLLGLGSAGAFPVVYRVLAKLMEPYKDAEITLQRGEAKTSFKGASVPEERALTKDLFG